MQNVRPLLVIFTLLSAPPLSAQAGEVYAGIGLPGLFAGYAHPVTEKVTLRADYATLGSRKKDGNEEGIDYQGHVKIARLGAFADYFPWANSGFRLTGGVTINQIQANLRSKFAAGTIQTVGNDTNVLILPGDRFNARIRFPRVTPFLGIGYGHQPVKTTGWSFHADLGVSIGRPKLDIDTNLVERGAISQDDVDEETRELRDGLANVRVIPQLSLGVSWRF